MLRKVLRFASFTLALSMILSALGIASVSQAASSDEMFRLVGFAALNGGTTGGTGGQEVLATSVSQVNEILNLRRKNGDTSPLIIKFDRRISGSEVIAAKEVSNITFIGVGDRGELDGVGINLVKSRNIIIRNLKIHHTKAPMDGIGIEDTKNVWVDHCEIYNMIGDCNGDGVVDTKGDISGGDVDWYDGLLDVKRSSEYITISWTYFHDSFKTSLVGASDSDVFDRKITFHHNIYSNVNSRTPSYRGGTGHMFNNYYVDVNGSGINSRMGAKLRIENNIFENVGSGSVDSKFNIAQGPIGSYYSSEIGYWDVKDNKFINSKGNQPTTSTCSFNPPYEYSSILNSTDELKSILTRYAGVGKIDGSAPPISITPAPTIFETPVYTPPTNISSYGDLNGDGVVSSTDYSLMKRHILGIVTIPSEILVYADFNLDGSVNSTDYSLFKKYILGVIPTLPYNASVATPSPMTPYVPTAVPSNPGGDKNGLVHEAEATSNNLKNARIVSFYVCFDAVKDAYVEMKNVESPIDGEVEIAFVYANGSGKGLPIEIKVNSDTVESNKEFPSTGSWEGWSILTIKANMAKGSGNIIRFKTRSADGGPYLDKVFVGGGSQPAVTSLPIQTPVINPTSTAVVKQTPTPVPQTSQPADGDIIIEPNGSISLQQAIDSIKPGKTVYLKPGTYKYSSTIVINEGNNGTSSSMKTIAPYGNGKPVLDFSQMAWGSSNRGIILSGNYWHIKGVMIQKAGDNGMLLSGHNNIIDGCEFYANGDTGLQLSRYNSSYNSIDQWPSNNTIQDCYSHSNYDQDDGEDADGFAAKLTCGKNNKFIRCVAKYNVDDGWDLYTKTDTGPIGSVYFEDCEASYNGKTESGQSTSDSDGNGFKLGGSKISVDHKLVNCKAFNNKKHGFTWNSNPGKLVLINCQSSGNGGNNFEKVANQ